MNEYPSQENLIKAAVIKHILANCRKIAEGIIPIDASEITFKDIMVIDDVILIPYNTGESLLAFMTEFRILDYTIAVQGVIDSDLKVDVKKISLLNQITEKKDQNTSTTNSNFK